MAASITITSLSLASNGKTLTGTLSGGSGTGYAPSSGVTGITVHSSGTGAAYATFLIASAAISGTTLTTVLASAVPSGVTVQFDMSGASNLTDSAANTATAATNTAITNGSSLASATIASTDARVVRGGYFPASGAVNSHNCYGFPANNSQMDLAFTTDAAHTATVQWLVGNLTDTDVTFRVVGGELQIQAYCFNPNNFRVSVDGAAFATPTHAASNSQFTWVTLATGLGTTAATFSAPTVLGTQVAGVSVAAGAYNAVGNKSYVKGDGDANNNATGTGSYDSLISLIHATSGFRFRGRGTSISVWCYANGSPFVLLRDGAVIASGTLPTGGTFGYKVLATGLTDSVGSYEYIDVSTLGSGNGGGFFHAIVFAGGTAPAIDTTYAPATRTALVSYGDSLTSLTTSTATPGATYKTHVDRNFATAADGVVGAPMTGASGGSGATRLNRVKSITPMDYLRVWFGTNDAVTAVTIGNATTSATFTGDYTSALNTLLTNVPPGAKINCLGVIPVSTRTAAYLKTYSDAIQVAIAACSAPSRVTFVDTTKWNLAGTAYKAGGTFDSTLYLDGTHLTDPGQTIVEQQLIPFESAVGYSLSAPTSGTAGVASGNGTVTIAAGSQFLGTQSITLTSDNPSDVITPSVGSPGTGSVAVTPANSATSFTYTITRGTGGTSTITGTNAQGWRSPATVTYAAVDPTPSVAPTFVTPTGTATSSVVTAHASGGSGTYSSYAYALVSGPSGATVSGLTSTASTATVGVNKAGTYVIGVTVTDNASHTSTQQTVSITFTAAIATISLTPSSFTVSQLGTRTVTPSALDQFGQAFSTTFTESVISGSGTYTGNVYTAPSSTGSATIQATSGSVVGSASATITDTTRPTLVSANSSTSGAYVDLVFSETIIYSPTDAFSFTSADPVSFSATQLNSTTIRVGVSPALSPGGSFSFESDGASITDASGNAFLGGTINVTNRTLGATADAASTTVTTASVGLTTTIVGGATPFTSAWIATAKPTGSTTTFSNSAVANPTLTVDKPGSYTLKVTVTDAEGTAVSSFKTINVVSTLTTITVSPSTPSIASNQTVQLSASAVDQFGTTLSPTLTWSVFSGPGTISSGGLYTASSAGTAVARATSGSVFGSATITVTSTDFPLFPAESDVRKNTRYGPTGNLLGTLPVTYLDPANVLAGVDRGDGVLGTLVLPSTGQVGDGVVFGPGSSLTGSLDVSPSGGTTEEQIQEIIDGVVEGVGTGGGDAPTAEQNAAAVKVALAGQALRIGSPVIIDDDGEQRVVIYAGSDYTAAHGSAIPFTIENYDGPNINNTPVALRFLKTATYKRSGSIAAAELEVTSSATQSGSTVTLAFDVTAEQSATITTQFPVDQDPTHRVQVIATGIKRPLVDIDGCVRRLIGAMA